MIGANGEWMRAAARQSRQRGTCHSTFVAREDCQNMADATSQQAAGALQVARHRWLQRGQGLVEYALIILLIAIAVIAILSLLGPAIGNIFSQIKPAL
jgi:pilus assembly protein Flp/PilA